MVLAGRLRFAEINTNDLPAFIISNSRWSSSVVHLVPRCCTVINATICLQPGFDDSVPGLSSSQRPVSLETRRSDPLGQLFSGQSVKSGRQKASSDAML